MGAGRGGEAGEVGEGAPEGELGADADAVDERLADGAADVDAIIVKNWLLP